MGRSGASAEGREGFQRLVADVGMGKAGIVIGLEVSRLARNNADWHRLLEICALTETLILDVGGHTRHRILPSSAANTPSPAAWNGQLGAAGTKPRPAGPTSDATFSYRHS
ncbi:MAG TPA: recombinase family protein [Kineosporiaceae bacterium]|nr:recombinase family protein [Kineosporiaceae bacterium]